MKNLFKILILSFTLLTSFTFSQQKVNINNLVEYGEKKFRQDSDKPYTGMIFDLYETNGQKKLGGYYRNGVKNGKWTYWYENGQKEREESYKDGESDGLWTHWYENGQKMYEGKFKNDNRGGLWEFWKENGENDFGRNYSNNEIIDEWTYHYVKYDNGNMNMMGIIKKDENDEWRQEGLWNIYYENGKVKETQNYIGGKLNGNSIIYYDNGKKSQESTWVNGLIEGLVTLYYKNGKVKETQNYIDGKLTSNSTIYYENGQKKEESTWVDGLREGLVTLYYGNGIIKETQSYIEGRLNGNSTYYENGHKKEEKIYKKGEIDGLWTQTQWYENGQIEFEGTFIEGERTGLHTWWIKDGKKIYEETFKNGKQESNFIHSKLLSKGKNIEKILIGEWIPEDGDGSFFISLKQNGSMDLYDDGELDEGESGIWFLIEDGDDLFITGKENDSNSMNIDKIILVNNNQVEIYGRRGKQIFNRKK